MGERGRSRRAAFLVLTALAAGALAAAGARALVRARRAARDVPLSPLTGGRFVGAEYPEREDIVAPPHPAGEMDDMAEYARPDFDPDAVHTEVRRFYERTSEFALSYRTTWHRGFRLGAALASRLTTRLEQLNLPGPRERALRTLESRIVGVDRERDPRDGARAWVRTGDAGEAVFVALYASHERDGEVYTNIAVPLPRSNLSTVLRIDALDTGDGTEDGKAGDGVRLTTRTGTGDEGLYLVTPLGAFALPLDQTFRVWPADAPGAPDDVSGGDATVVARHEMWILGRRFLTIDYAGWPRERDGVSEEGNDAGDGADDESNGTGDESDGTDDEGDTTDGVD